MKSDSPDDDRPSEQEAIEATAAAWLAQKDDGLTPAQAADFDRWQQADPRHAQAVARLEGAWGALQALRDFRPESARHPDPDLLRPAAVSSRRIIPFPRRLATGLAAALAIGVAWWAWDANRSHLPATPHYATTVDGFERVSLEDGSVVELNGASEISVQFTTGERRVRLLRGEAHFTVAKSQARPFRVTAGSVAVQAIGTAFNVRLGASDVDVLVTEGKVALDSAAETRTTHAQPSSPPEIKASTLSANERAVVTLAPAFATTAVPVALPVPVIRSVTPEEIREALAWQSPRLVFSDTPLADAVAQFNRRNPIQVELAEPELGTLPMGGSFRADNVEAFIRLLETGGDVRVQRVDSTRIVLHRAK